MPTPWIETAAPKHDDRMIFQLAKTMETALQRLKSGEPMPRAASMDMDQFKEIVDLQRWKAIEEKFADSRD